MPENNLKFALEHEPRLLAAYATEASTGELYEILDEMTVLLKVIDMDLIFLTDYLGMPEHAPDVVRKLSDFNRVNMRVQAVRKELMKRSQS